MRACLSAAAFWFVLGFTAADDPKKPATLGEKIVAFCAENKGKTVGDGECADLVSAALKAAGAKGRGKDDPNPGDYTWGELVYKQDVTINSGTQTTGKRTDIKPGDVIQFRDTRWDYRSGNKISITFSPHHTAVVNKVEQKGTVLKVYHQNAEGKKEVIEGTYRLNTLTQGWVRIYRPVEAASK